MKANELVKSAGLAVNKIGFKLQKKSPEILVITGVVGVVVSAVMACKATTKVNDEVIPVVCGVTGGILGVAGMYLMPEFPATDVINAAAIGIVSGLAATGAHQVIKQVGKM